MPGRKQNWLHEENSHPNKIRKLIRRESEESSLSFWMCVRVSHVCLCVSQYIYNHFHFVLSQTLGEWWFGVRMKGRNEVNIMNWLEEITLQVKRSPENGREGNPRKNQTKKSVSSINLEKTSHVHNVLLSNALCITPCYHDKLFIPSSAWVAEKWHHFDSPLALLLFFTRNECFSPLQGSFNYTRGHKHMPVPGWQTVYIPVFEFRSCHF